MSSSVPLVALSLGSFAETLAAPAEPAAGGSAAAAVGAFGAALVSMAYRITAREEGAGSGAFALGRAEELEDLRDLLLELVDRDAEAWSRFAGSRGQEGGTARKAAREAVEVPLEVAEHAAAARRLLEAGRGEVPARLASDLVVADACLRAALSGALAVVEANLAALGEGEPVEELRHTVAALRTEGPTA